MNSFCAVGELNHKDGLRIHTYTPNGFFLMGSVVALPQMLMIPKRSGKKWPLALLTPVEAGEHHLVTGAPGATRCNESVRNCLGLDCGLRNQTGFKSQLCCNSASPQQGDKDPPYFLWWLVVRVPCVSMCKVLGVWQAVST